MIDLHTHSTMSDGSLSPEALVDYAITQHVSVLALTDHDSVSGVKVAIDHADSLDITIIPGIELSVLWRNVPLHIVGLEIDIDCQALKALIDEQGLRRQRRAEDISSKLATLGFQDAYQKANNLTDNGLITRPHFAHAMVAEGFCKDIKTAFKRFLKRGKPAYVPVEWVSLERCLQIISDAGGKSVLAHPLRYDLTNTKLRCLLDDFKAGGGVAIEVVSGWTNDNEVSRLGALCKEYELAASMGSDFHGHTMTPSVMGRLKALPKGCEMVIEGHDGES